MSYLDPRTNVAGSLFTTCHASPLFAGAEVYAARVREAVSARRDNEGPTVGAALSKLTAALYGELKRSWRRAETRRQLSRMTSHQLRDIGLLDADLVDVARALASEDPQHKR